MANLVEEVDLGVGGVDGVPRIPDQHHYQLHEGIHCMVALCPCHSWCDSLERGREGERR